MVWLMPHVMEQYNVPHEGYLQDKLQSTTNLIEIGPKVVKPKDYALASNFMWSCTMALNGLIQKACQRLGNPYDWS
jgi:NADP-dependent alcohol dehydrogenase